MRKIEIHLLPAGYNIFSCQHCNGLAVVPVGAELVARKQTIFHGDRPSNKNRINFCCSNFYACCCHINPRSFLKNYSCFLFTCACIVCLIVFHYVSFSGMMCYKGGTWLCDRQTMWFSYFYNLNIKICKRCINVSNSLECHKVLKWRYSWF